MSIKNDTKTATARYLFPAFVLQCLSGALVLFLPARLIHSSYPLLPLLPNIWLGLSVICGLVALRNVAVYSYMAIKTKEPQYRSGIALNAVILVVSIASLILTVIGSIARAG